MQIGVFGGSDGAIVEDAGIDVGHDTTVDMAKMLIQKVKAMFTLRTG